MNIRGLFLQPAFCSFSDNRSIQYRMVELKLKRTLLRLDFSFFAVIALYLLLDESGFGLAALAACAMHETAHFIAMTAFGVPVEQLTLYGAGIRITSSRIEHVKPICKAVILGAGCIVNFAAAFMFFKLGKYDAFAVNLFTGIFNLLPMGELDGARLLKMPVVRHCKAENVDRVMKIAAVSAAVVCIAAFTAAGGGVSFTLITTAAYIIIVSGLS